MKILPLIFIGLLVFGCKSRTESSQVKSGPNVGELRGFSDLNVAIRRIFFEADDSKGKSFAFNDFAKIPDQMRKLVGYSNAPDDNASYAPSAASFLALNYQFNTLIDHLIAACGLKATRECALGDARSKGVRVVKSLYGDEPYLFPVYNETVGQFSVDRQEFKLWETYHKDILANASTEEQKDTAIREVFLSVFLHPKFLLRSF